jgi:hypothetical protein
VMKQSEMRQRSSARRKRIGGASAVEARADYSRFQKSSMRNFTTNEAIARLPERRFLPPWSAEVMPNCFNVADANDQDVPEY